MKTKYLSGLFLLVVACSGGQTTGGHGGQSTLEQKRAAAEAHARGEKQSGDVCAANGWYGDGECDTFCQDADTGDCVVPDPGPVCAAFIELSDGVCSRAPNDPCRGQDPDCEDVKPGPGPICPATLVALPYDGVCTTDPKDPCVERNDPDCTAREYCDFPIAYPADGVCQNPDDICVRENDPDCQVDPEPGPICPGLLVALPYDGVCTTDPNDPCVELHDPDCQEPPTPDPGPGPFCGPEQASDGVCGPKYSYCDYYTDPDCHSVPVPEPGPTCPPSLQAPDGVCKTDPNNICVQLSDPDCANIQPVPPVQGCTLIIENPDGVCRRAPNDPCIAQDPDCATESK